MSVSRRRRTAWAIPAQRASSVARLRASAAAVTSPTGTVIAASPCQPATMAPQSIEIRSPSASTRDPGMPCTTSSLTEVQITAGNPW